MGTARPMENSQKTPARALVPAGRPRVAVVRCASYESGALSSAVLRSLELAGGWRFFPKPGGKVFVKVNHLSPHAPPERAVCTHPMFVREVLRVLLERDFRVTVGDDVNFGRGDEFRTTGFRQMCAELRVPLVNLRESGFAEVPLRGELLTSVFIARPVLEADLVLNLPKLKTHSFTIFTGAVKNMYGVVPCGQRLEGHRRFPGRDSFSRMLVDIFSAVRRQFTLMDAVVGMDGEGPSAGYPKKVGLIISGADGVAVDAVASRATGHDPLQVPTTTRAQARGLGVGDLRSIEVVGEKMEDVEVKDFRRSWAATGLFSRRLPSALYAYVNGRLVLTPEVVPDKCSGCLDCLRICPAGTIGLVRQKARIDEAGCIHCLCCHEVCLQRSIRLKQRPLGRLLRSGSRLHEGMRGLLRQK